MAELEKPNFLMMDASEYGKKLVADRKMLKSREALVTEWAPRAGGLEVMTPPLRGGGRGFDSHPAHHPELFYEYRLYSEILSDLNLFSIACNEFHI